jgi:hypothetical protein
MAKCLVQERAAALGANVVDSGALLLRCARDEKSDGQRIYENQGPQSEDGRSKKIAAPPQSARRCPSTQTGLLDVRPRQTQQIAFSVRSDIKTVFRKVAHPAQHEIGCFETSAEGEVVIVDAAR